MKAENCQLFINTAYEISTHWLDKAVLVFVRRGEEILLIEKLRGLGAGKVNGPGGKLEAGEDWETAARRETLEEVGLHVGALEHLANLGFVFADGYSLGVKVYVCRDYQGEAGPSPEAIPFWCPVAAIPWERMWADDVLWLPQVLAGEFVEGAFRFDGDRMLEAQVSGRPMVRAT